jgi:hypothetical protein
MLAFVWHALLMTLNSGRLATYKLQKKKKEEEEVTFNTKLRSETCRNQKFHM